MTMHWNFEVNFRDREVLHAQILLNLAFLNKAETVCEVLMKNNATGGLVVAPWN